MSLPPYVPPTEEEFTALHARLSEYIDAHNAIAQALGLKGDLAYLPRVLEQAERMRRRIEALDIAVRW